MLRISHFHRVLLMLVLSSITLLPCTSAGETSFAAVAPFVDNQTFLIGRLDVQKLQLGDLQARLTAIIEKISGDSNAAQNMAPVAAQAQQLRTAFLGSWRSERICAGEHFRRPCAATVLRCDELGSREIGRGAVLCQKTDRRFPREIRDS